MTARFGRSNVRPEVIEAYDRRWARRHHALSPSLGGDPGKRPSLSDYDRQVGERNPSFLNRKPAATRREKERK